MFDLMQALATLQDDIDAVTLVVDSDIQKVRVMKKPARR